MKKILTLLTCLLIAGFSFGQDYVLTGNVKDVESTPLLGATVVVLDGADSTMVAFGVTDETGKFLVYEVPEGEIVLQISYTGYTDYMEAMTIAGNQTKIEVESVVLEVSSAVLEEVSIKAEHIPMGILGDTINYNAAAFKTRPGASVEDLLKKLPGIEIARDGSIKAQGEDVNNVLVDGKEFFSGDATIATKNLEAEAVDKVQVFDKMSEEAEFTGVDDGQEEKTINLKLKEGYKSGGFGKVAVDVGSESTRQAKLNYNRFSPSVQASIIGNTNNINNEAFSFNEYIDFMGGFQNVLALGGLNEYGLNSGGRGAQQGIRDQKSLGSNLNVDFSKAIKLNANYLFAQNKQTLDQTGSTENFTGDEAFTTVDTSQSSNKTTNHRLNTKLKYNPNPFNAFTLNTRLYTLGSSNLGNSMTEYLVNGLNQNRTSSNSSIANTSFNINSSLLYKKKFAKKGRNWISSMFYENFSQDEETDLENVFQSDLVEEAVNQFQMFTNARSSLTADSKFTEPLSKNLYLGMDYTFGRTVQTPLRDYFNRVEEQLVLDSEISTLFESQWTYHDVGVSLKRTLKKLRWEANLDYWNTKLVAMDDGIQVNEKDNYNYILPALNARWKMKGSKTLELGYSTRVNAPQLSQMITQVNNLNPNFLILGNPTLTPEYIHSLRMSFSSYDQFNFSNHFASLTMSYSPDRIVNSRTFREDLVTEVLPVNAGNHFSLNGYYNHHSPIRKLKIKYNVSTSFNYATYTTFINDVANDISTANLNFNVGFENRNKDVVDISVGLRMDVSAFSNEFNSNFDAPFANYSWFTDGFLILGKGFNVGASFDYRTFNGGLGQEAQALNLLDASLTKTMMGEKLTFKITAHDLLNQNRGISRSGDINTLSDARYNTLSRYIMVGVSYRLGMVRKGGLGF
ncbi:MAG: outer membrane beta-barrel protein [Saprospiraceae bacterium]|nr:outer membrane beta-barrel protein [Saprospiraceae bacterium]